jgi:hypothetical protein
MAVFLKKIDDISIPTIFYNEPTVIDFDTDLSPISAFEGVLPTGVGTYHVNSPGNYGFFDDVDVNMDYTWQFEVAPIPEPAYTCIGFEPPCDSPDVALTVKKNKCIPLKTELIDEDGFAITDADIEYPPVLFPVDFVGGTILSDVVAVDGLAPSQATDGNQFEFIGGRWCFNLKIKDYYKAPGKYIFEMRTGNSEEYIIEPTCTVTIVVEK